MGRSTVSMRLRRGVKTGSDPGTPPRVDATIGPMWKHAACTSDPKQLEQPTKNGGEMRIAIVGCGFVADLYVQTLVNHPSLELAGVFDRNPERLSRFANFYGLRSYPSLEDVLHDSTIQLIANLTNPPSHFAVSQDALKAGKHVYSEKPLAMTMGEAQQLVALAGERGVMLSCAPCNLLGETAQTFWKALRDGSIGTPRLAYAELDEGQLFLNYRSWLSRSGSPWPFEDEFEIGCTLEHAGYYLGWLTAFFGPATQIVSALGVHSDTQGPVKNGYAPAFATASIDFASGLTARITCSTFTAGDHSFRVFGDDGILSTPDCWDYASPIYLSYRVPKSWRDSHPHRAELLGMRRKVPLVRPARFLHDERRGLRMDFARGLAELAHSLDENRKPRMSAEWSLHVTELALAMNAGERFSHRMHTAFAPIAPMPWAI